MKRSNLMTSQKLSTKSMLIAALWCIAIFAVGDIQAQSSYKVYLAAGVMTPPPNAAEAILKTKVKSSELFQGRYMRLIQFAQIPNARAIGELKAMGLDLQGYIDFGAYLVEFPQDFDLNKLASFGVRSILPIDARWKVAPKLFEQPYASWAWDGQKLATIISLKKGVEIGAGADLLRRAGVQFRQTLPNPAMVYAFIEPSQILDISALPYVSYIELIPPSANPEDDKGRALHRANLVDSESAIGPKYTGAGISILTRDDGGVGPHIDFQGRINNIATEFGPTHGDGVSGIFTGAGNLDPDKRGMAAGAELYVIDYVNKFSRRNLALALEPRCKK